MIVALIIILLIIIAIVVYISLIMPRAVDGADMDMLSCDFAHRGLWNENVPENSLAAFMLAAKAGYGIELDIQLSKDGRIVVFHDSNLLTLLYCESVLNIIEIADQPAVLRRPVKFISDKVKSIFFCQRYFIHDKFNTRSNRICCFVHNKSVCSFRVVNYLSKTLVTRYMFIVAAHSVLNTFMRQLFIWI